MIHGRLLLLAVAASLTLPTGAWAQDMPMSSGGQERFVHPFLAHMGLPDEPGEVSLRLTTFRQRDAAGSTFGDLAYHLEAGLGAGLGLHIRSDALRYEPYSEVMPQYALFENSAGNSGLSLFGQVSIPSGPVSGNRYKGLVGVSGTLPFGGAALWNGDIHYNPDEKMGEYESALVFRGSEQLFPLLEVRGEFSDSGTSAYVLPAIKFRVGEGKAFGIGYQLGASKDREYETQTLLTMEMVF